MCWEEGERTKGWREKEVEKLSHTHTHKSKSKAKCLAATRVTRTWRSQDTCAPSRYGVLVLCWCCAVSWSRARNSQEDQLCLSPQVWAPEVPPTPLVVNETQPVTHTHTHTRTHARKHKHTHTHTHTHTNNVLRPTTHTACSRVVKGIDQNRKRMEGVL